MAKTGPDLDFIQNLRAGDKAAIYDSLRGHICNVTVSKVTPTGLIKVGDGRTVFRASGWQRDPVYYQRHLGPAQKLTGT